MHLSVSRSQYYFLNFQCSILLGWIGIGMDGTRFCSRNNRNWLDFLRLFQDLPMWYFIFTEFFFYLAQEMIRRNCDCVPTVFCRGYFFGCFFLLGFTGFFFTVGSLVRTSPSRGHKSVDCGKNCCDTPPYWSTTTGYFFFQKKKYFFFLGPNSNRFRHFAAELRAFLFLLLFCFVFQFFLSCISSFRFISKWLTCLQLSVDGGYGKQEQNDEKYIETD